MGRKAKCTAEEKVTAVEDYLNGIRSISEIMNDLDIKSKRSIYDWIAAYNNQGADALLTRRVNRTYTSEFKLMVVKEYLSGAGSFPELSAKYGIPGHSILQNWIKKYNSDMELKDYNPKQEVYMASARRNEVEVWLMSIGELLDQWEIHKQFNGMAKPKFAMFIDDIIPYGI